VPEPAPPRQTTALQLHAQPNPFAGRTVIDYTLPDAGEVEVRVFDVSGRHLRTLVDGRRLAGRHVIEWNGHGSPGTEIKPGIYFVRVKYGDSTRALKLLHLR
jgi:flagellar hook assembly protein FlgD